MSAVDLQNQLSALSDSLKTTTSLISRLAKLQFQPGSEPLEGEGGVRIELTQDIHDSLKQLEEELEFLKQEADDLKAEGGLRRRQTIKDADDSRLSAKVARLGEELIHSRQQFRNAQITAKLASDEAKRKERELVIEGYRKEAEQLAAAAEGANGPVGSDRDQLFARRRGNQQSQQRQLTKDEILVNASSDVTAALRRTHDLLSTELSRSRFAQETFDESTAALSQLGEDYSNLDSILSNSRNLLGTLLRSQKSDTWYLETAFYILLTTLCWLFFRRILFGPFFKLPLFLYRCLIFLSNWLLLKPFWFFCTATGIITSEAVTSSRRVAPSISTSRPPLIVQPSAKGPPPSYPQGSGRGVPAGAGGVGAKVGQESRLAGELSEDIGRMAEESNRRGDGTVLQDRGDIPKNPKKKNFEAGVEDAKQAEKELPKRGDGTVLRERGDEPPNPKKKNFEADVENSKQEGAQRRKRDEL